MNSGTQSRKYKYDCSIALFFSPTIQHNVLSYPSLSVCLDGRPDGFQRR
jgi:hypothetical protein